MKRWLIMPLLALPLLAGELPALYRMEVLVLFSVAGIYALTAFRIKIPTWCMCQEFRGVMFVSLGAIAMWVPPQFLISSWLVGMGARMVMGGPRVTQPTSNDIVIKGSNVMESLR